MKYSVLALIGVSSAVKLQHKHHHHHHHAATPLSNFHPQPRNNWESADIDADNSRKENDIPEHCIHSVAGHCGITSSKQVAQPTTYGPQPPAGGLSVVYPTNNMIAQLAKGATPLSNFHPWPRNNWESADIDADNSRKENDIPEHCIHSVAGHCGITSSKQVAQPTTYGPQPPAGGLSVVYPSNNMIAQVDADVEATPLSNFHPWPRTNFESADIDADNSRKENDIPEHCIHSVAGHCGITSSKMVAQPTQYGPQPDLGGRFAVIYPVNNMIAQIGEEGPLYVPHAHAGLKGFDLSKLEHCPDFNERFTLVNGKTKAVAYPAAGFNCNAAYGL